MKLKYYLRGLGIGILVTGLVMGVSKKNAVASARAEIMRSYAQEALEEEASEASEPSSTDEAESEPLLVRESEPEADSKPEINWEDITGEDINNPEAPDLNEEAPREDDLQENNLQENDLEAEEPEDGSSERASSAAPEEPSEAVVIVNPGAAALDMQTVTITISKGDDSGTVSRKLYNAGVIDSASEYDAFLMQHGYDKRINTGEKVISLNDSWQEIAEKITH
ncbi:MAG: hypothetical protein NC337_05615 [Roseburia sp.]|nr:hypothetical protein [Roseburia sp.]